MNYRRLGNSGLKVSEVGLGSWLTYGSSTEADISDRCIQFAFECGINFFDTANGYARGAAEIAVGKTLSKFPRESFVLATKVFMGMGDGPNDHGLSRKHIFEQCHASLKRLGVDYIDLYQAHRFDADVPVEETLLAFNDLVKQGKILYYGVSEWTGDQITDAVHRAEANRLRAITSNQPQYSLLARGIEKSVIPVCETAGIGQVVFSPLAQGLLTGKYKAGQPAPAGSRASDPRQNEFLKTGELDTYVHDRVRVDDALLVRIQGFVAIADEIGLSPSQMALAWCLRQPNVASVIIGASRPEQIQDNIGAAGVVLTSDVLNKIDAVLEYSPS